MNTLNPKNCKDATQGEKVKRSKLLRYRWRPKNLLKKWRVDTGSKEFDKEFDARTLSEQGFSVGKAP